VAFAFHILHASVARFPLRCERVEWIEIGVSPTEMTPDFCGKFVSDRRTQVAAGMDVEMYGIRWGCLR
jgi:hypothetical protein